MRNRGWLIIGLAGAGLLALPFLREGLGFPLFYLTFVASILFWGTQATSWNILSGYSGYFSFGQGAFYGVGVYTLAVLLGRRGVDWWIAVPAGGIVAMLLGLFLGAIAFRLRSLRGEIFALLTLAIPFILLAVVRLVSWIDGGLGIVVPIPNYPEFLGPPQHFYYLLTVLVALFAVGVAYWMQRSRYGWALFAIHDDEEVAEGLGVPTFKHKMIAIGLTGFIGGISGAVFAINMRFVTPEGTFRLREPLFVIVMAVLGGRRHWAGPLVGAAFVYTLQSVLSGSQFDGYSLIALGAILIFFVLFAPEGLMARFVRRPRMVAGVFAMVFVGMLVAAVPGGLNVWLLSALGAAAIVGLLPVRSGPAVRTKDITVHVGAGGEDARDGPSPPIGRPLIVASDVKKSFGGVHALRGVSVTVSEGELVGLVGPNGSGKTTFVNLVSGAFAPTEGSITLDGRDIVDMPPHKIAHLGMARTYQIPRPFNTLTVRDNVAIAIMFGREPMGLDQARSASEEHLVMVGLEDLADALPGGINLHERQLLEMARAVATRPKVLLLDEALAGLNPVEIDNAVGVVRRIHQSGVSIVLVEHLLRVVNRLSTRMVVLDQGLQLAEGDPAVVLQDPAVVTAYLGKQGNA